MHDITLITTIAFGLTSALVFGLLAKRVGLSPIIGYLFGGMAIGPHTPGFVGDLVLAAQLAEIGVMLLMFGVGMHFHLKDLLAVRTIAVPGALGQSAAATICCAAVAVMAGGVGGEWTWTSGAVLGIATAVASTVVLLRVLMDNGLVDTAEGHVAIGWLVVEDIITVLVLVMLPALAAGSGSEVGLLPSLGMAVVKLAVMGAIVMVLGARFVPWLLLRVARLRSSELFTLTVLVMALAVATISYMAFGASMALGAFLAGMVVGQSKVSHQAAADALPMRDAFAVLFFVSVGMLFDYSVLWKSPVLTLGVLGIVLIVKPVTALVIVILSRRAWRTGLAVAGGLAQIGEFSFILAEMAKSLKLMPGEGHDVLVAVAIVSISLNPFVFRGLMALEPWMTRNRWLSRGTDARGEKINARAAALAKEPERVRAIVVGYGPGGRTVTRLLREFDINPTIIEMNVDTVIELQGSGGRALYGDATRASLLTEAGIGTARYLIVTVPDADTSLAVITAARSLNAEVRILTRARFLREREHLEQAGATTICYDEAESAVGLAEVLLVDIRAPSHRISEEVRRIRDEFGPQA